MELIVEVIGKPQVCAKVSRELALNIIIKRDQFYLTADLDMDGETVLISIS